MAAYYNENNARMADKLRGLVAAGLIAPGDVDERSISDVKPHDLDGYTQCHFFAGIGGWSYALRGAGFSDDQPVWTGSCPCQPFSAAGKGDGFADERHLWPHWFHLISQCRPEKIYGEQVASKDGLNWFDLVQADLEGAKYAVAAADMCAAGVGAPHIRQRLWFVAHRYGEGPQGRPALRERPDQRTLGARSLVEGMGNADVNRTELVTADHGEAFNCATKERQNDSTSLPKRAMSAPDGMAHTDGGYTGTERKQCNREQRLVSQDRGGSVGMADGDDQQHAHGQARRSDEHDTTGRIKGSTTSSGLCVDNGMGNTTSVGHDRCAGGQEHDRRTVNETSLSATVGPPTTSPTNGFWTNPDWLFCRDDKWRPVEPGTFPLAYGLPRGMGSLSPELRTMAALAGLDGPSLKAAKAFRVDSLSGYGNAIVPDVAIEFIRSTM